MGRSERDAVIMAAEERRRRDDPTACRACGRPMLPRLTTGAQPIVRDDGPLCADVPIRLVCPTCE